MQTLVKGNFLSNNIFVLREMYLTAADIYDKRLAHASIVFIPLEQRAFSNVLKAFSFNRNVDLTPYSRLLVL